MCAPVVYGMMALAAVAQAYSAKQSANAQQRASEINADIARQAAANARQRGEFAETVQRRKTSQLIGRQVSLIASGGALLGEGSASLIIADAETQGEMDALNARNNAMREAWGLEAQASQFDFQGRAAKQAGRIGVTTSLIGGAANIAGASSGSLLTSGSDPFRPTFPRSGR